MTSVKIVNKKSQLEGYGVGDYFLDEEFNSLYILSEIGNGYDKIYELVNVKDGTSYGNPASKPSDVFCGHDKNFSYVKNININIGG